MDKPLLQGGGQEPADDVLPEGSDRRRPVLALAALAVVALAVGGVLAVTSGSDPAETVADGSVTAPVAPAATPTSSASASPRERAVATGETRNPFAALVLTSTSSDPAAEGAAPAPAPGDAAAADPQGQPAPAGGGTTGGSAPDVGTGRGSGTESGAAPDQVRTLALVRTTGEGDGRVAVFDLDGDEQSAAVGAAFGPDDSLLLLSVQQGPTEGQWTAVVQRGSGDPFDVVTGTPVALD